MTRKQARWYPGKPGPAPTGLKRDILFPLALSKTEWEHLCRLENKAKAEGAVVRKKAPLIRARVFKRGELERLRRDQGANIA